MKKIQKTIQNTTFAPQFNNKSDKKLELIKLLPQILKIMPQFNLNNKKDNFQSQNQQLNTTVKTENYRFASSSMEQHRQKVQNIKNNH